MNSIYTQILQSTSQNLNMTRHYLKADTKRLAEYWEVAWNMVISTILIWLSCFSIPVSTGI